MASGTITCHVVSFCLLAGEPGHESGHCQHSTPAHPISTQPAHGGQPRHQRTDKSRCVRPRQALAIVMQIEAHMRQLQRQRLGASTTITIRLDACCDRIAQYVAHEVGQEVAVAGQMAIMLPHVENRVCAPPVLSLHSALVGSVLCCAVLCRCRAMLCLPSHTTTNHRLLHMCIEMFAPLYSNNWTKPSHVQDERVL